MGTILLVRHGQAAAQPGNYDCLSPLDEGPCDALGRGPTASRVRADMIRSGVLRRQRVTANRVAGSAGWVDKVRQDAGWDEAVCCELDASESRSLDDGQREIDDAQHMWQAGGAQCQFGGAFVHLSLRTRRALAAVASELGRVEQAVVITSGGVIGGLAVVNGLWPHLNHVCDNCGVTKLMSEGAGSPVSALDELGRLPVHEGPPVTVLLEVVVNEPRQRRTVHDRGQPDLGARRPVSLEGRVKTALITGASRGIGRGIAFDLSLRGYGLSVTSRGEEDLADLAPRLLAAGAAQVLFEPVDLADQDALPSLIDLHKESFGTMDALVLSGGVGTACSLDVMSVHRVAKTMAVNFTSAVTLVQRALPLLRRRSGGERCRGPCGLAGLDRWSLRRARTRGLRGLRASKASLVSWAEAVNAEESGRGVMATAIASAYVRTDMSAWTTDRVPADSMIPVEDIVGGSHAS